MSWNLSEKGMNTVKYLLLLLLLAGTILPAEGTVATPVPRLMVESPGRSEYLLNGLWHFKPFDRMPGQRESARDSGYYMRVPGEWFNFLGKTDQLTDSGGKILPAFPFPAGKRWPDAEIYGLYELHFSTPLEFQGKRVILNLAGIQFQGDIFFNDHRLGTQYVYENNFYDVTELLTEQKTNVVKIALRPFLEVPNAFGNPGVTRRLTHGGIMHDVRLFVLEHGVMARYALIDTAREPRRAKVKVRLENYGGPRCAEAQLTLHSDGLPRKTVTRKIELPAGRSYAELELPLDGIEFWEPEAPKLHRLDFRLNERGKIIASIPETITGFREVRLEGTRLLVNGVARTLFGESGSRLDLLMNQCTGIYPAQQLSSMRAMGFNYVNMLDFPTQEPILAAADRIGIFLGPVIKQDADLIFKKHAAFPGLTRLDGKTIPEDELTRFRKQFTDLSEYYATHPSVLAYVRMFNWLCDCELAYNPHLAGRREHSSDERAAFADRILAETGAIDPTRLNYLHHAGGRGPIYTHNRYWNCAVPLQEKADFPKLWAADRSPDKMPFFVTEGNLFPGWPSLYPKWGNSPRNPAWRGLYGPYAVREISALDLGAAAYYLPADERAIRPAHIRSLITQAGAMRHYGTLGHMMHTDSYCGYEPGKMIDTADELSDNVPGFVSINHLWRHQHPSTRLTSLGEAMLHAFSSNTFYLMGPPDAPTTAPHNEYGGRTIERTMFVINESGIRRELDFDITLTGDDGTVWWRNPLTVDAVPGFRKQFVLRLPLPEVKKRTGCTLRVRMASVPGRTAEQQTRLAVFPERKPEPLKGTVAVFDPEHSLDMLLKRCDSDTATLLEQLESLDAVDAILVGRSGLNLRFGELAKKLDIGGFLNRGGRIAVFEQAGEKLLNLTLDARRARNVFPALPAHPLLTGLETEDLSNWQGGSSLLKAFPPAPAGFHWSEPIVTSVDGIVASYPIEKPHVGNFIPILESGFDLQFTPLLELHHGSGRVWFCQLDLTNRIGLDPAATLLAENLLKLALEPSERKPVRAGYAGNETGRAFLSGLGRSTKAFRPGDPLLILGPEADRQLTAGAVESHLRSGGTVLTLPGAPAALLPIRPEPAVFEGVNGFSSWEEARQNRLPASLSDLFFRTPVQLPGWRFAGGTGSPLLGEVPFGSGRIIYCNLPTELPAENIYRMKPVRLWSVLLTSLGLQDESFDAGEMLASAGASMFVPLGGSADFRLDPDDIGLKDNWYLPNSAVNRNEWRKITVPGAWEKTPFLENFGPPNPPPAAPEYDGIAFYRFEVMIPEYLRGRKCILNLGVVDDFDTTFFNGRKIGGMNAAFGPQTYTTNRVYRVPEQLIRYGQTNTITVRVEDNAGAGGIVHGKLRLEFTSGQNKTAKSAYLPEQSIFEIFGTTPYYNEQW